MKREHEIVKCVDCGKEILKDYDLYSDMHRASSVKNAKSPDYSTCADLWESIMELEDMEAENGPVSSMVRTSA